MKCIRRVVVLFFIIISGFSCNKYAENPTESMTWLLATIQWEIVEIKANDQVIMKDGISIPTFSGLEFNRYMKTIRFSKDGYIDGQYNIGEAKTPLRWKINPQNIEIYGKDQPENSGTWLILPQNVTQREFIMRTTSTAFDFPRETTIEIVYRSLK